MAKKLPYSVITDTLKHIDFSFDLSSNTTNPLAVHQLLNEILSSISKETKLRNISNGDIIQAISMAMAVRVKMTYGDDEIKESIALNCIKSALSCSKGAVEKEEFSGTS